MKQTLTQNKNRATNTITTLIADQEHLYNLEFCSPGVKRVASHLIFFQSVQTWVSWSQLQKEIRVPIDSQAVWRMEAAWK